MNITFFTLPLMGVIISAVLVFLTAKGESRGKKSRRLIANLCVFFIVCAVAIALPLQASASATESQQSAAPSESTPASSSGSGLGAGIGYLAAALATGIASIGAGIAVAAAAPAAIGAFSEDPKAFGKALIFVALGEGIALYGLLISILILNKM